MTINKSLAEIDPIQTESEKKEKARAEILTTKSQTSDRQIPINAEISEALKIHKKWHSAEMKKNGYKSPYVFTTASGSLYFKSSVRTAFKRLCKQIGVEPRGFHTFRRTFGTKLAAADVPIQTLCAIMGHSDISVTARYYINIPSKDKIEALSRLKLY